MLLFTCTAKDKQEWIGYSQWERATFPLLAGVQGVFKMGLALEIWEYALPSLDISCTSTHRYTHIQLR